MCFDNNPNNSSGEELIFIESNENLTLANKMRAIRKTLGWTQLQLATEMGYSSTTIDNYEHTRYRVTDEVLRKFRQATGTEGVPLKNDEIVAYKKDIYSRNYSLNHNDKKQVNELLHMLAKCAKFSFDTDLQILCNLLSAIYYFTMNNKKECDRIIDSLSTREHEFTDEHYYWYYRCLGLIQYTLRRYKSALALYLKAEEHGKRVNPDLNINIRSLYYNIGLCFTFMNYPIQANEYFEKLHSNELDSHTVLYGFNIQRFLAINASMLGQTQKALKKLENCINYAISEKKISETRFAATYLDIGIVYQDAGNFEKALENFAIASSYFDKKSEVYLEYMCHKAVLLRSYNRDEVLELVNKGLSMATKGTLWYEWLDAVKHSKELDNQASLMYLECTLIPRLLEYGKHLLVMNCYEWISDHSKKAMCYKPALKYSEKAKKIFSQLMKGDLSL